MCPLRGKCRFCKEEGHFARNCPNRNRSDWGEASTDGAAPANAEEGPATPADSAPSSAGIDLRDNQLDELSGSVAPGSASSSDSLEGATVVSRVDSLDGATVVSQEQAPVNQSILAELNVPNSNSCDAPNSNDCFDLSSSIDLFNECNESSIVTLNNNETSTANNNVNNESGIHSNDSSGNNGNSESIMHSNDSSGNNGNSESINVTLPNNNRMEVLDYSSDSDSDGSDDPEIRSDASIASLDVDGSSLDSVYSVYSEGFAVPLPKRAPHPSPSLLASPFFPLKFNVISINANCLRMADKRAGFLQWLHSLPVVVDVVCIQEYHCVSLAECDLWFRSSGFPSVVSPGSKKSCGCVVLFRPTLSLVQSWADEEGRLLQCEFSFCDQSFCVILLYAPNRNPVRNQFLEQLADEVDPSIPTLLCGDFNTVFDRNFDCSGSDSSDTWRESSAALATLFESCCCIDAWRYLHPTSAGFSWTRPDGSISSLIGLIRCPYIWVSSMSSCDFVSCPYSDHCAVLFSVFVPGIVPPVPGLWKLNASILNEDDYVQLITSYWGVWRTKMLTFFQPCQVVGGW